ncbi:MAG: hypothetical protein ACYDCL_00670 [Myxococcales bacterium]
MDGFPGKGFASLRPSSSSLRVGFANAPDGDEPADVGERRHRLAEPALAEGHQRLHDVAHEAPALRPARRDGLARVDAPDDLVGSGLDLVALEEVPARR